MVSLKHLSNFWRTLEMPLINCDISLMLSWSEKCFLVTGNVANQVPTFTITQQAQNQYLDLLIDPCFHGVNSLFVLSFENDNDQDMNDGCTLLGQILSQ